MFTLGQSVRVKYGHEFDDIHAYVRAKEGEVGEVRKIVPNESEYWPEGTYFYHVYFADGSWGIWANNELEAA